MEKDALLRDTVAGFLGVDANAIGPDFPLSRKLAGSLARATLDAAIRRRVGVKSRAVYTARTYGELQAAILGDGSPVPSSAAASPPPTEAPDLPTDDGEHAACGVDMELVEHLPAAEDYWEHEFYRANFTRAEIAYCLTREHPREHFAARWSAKEALKKCHPIAMSLDMNEIEVTLNESGAPTLRHVRDGTFSPLHYAVSMSHTPVAAALIKSHK